MGVAGLGLTYYTICIKPTTASWERLGVSEPTELEGIGEGEKALSLSPEADDVALGWG